MYSQLHSIEKQQEYLSQKGYTIYKLYIFTYWNKVWVRLHLPEMCLAKSNTTTAFERNYFYHCVITPDVFPKSDQIRVWLMWRPPPHALFWRWWVFMSPLVTIFGGSPGSRHVSCVDNLAQASFLKQHLGFGKESVWVQWAAWRTPSFALLNGYTLSCITKWSEFPSSWLLSSSCDMLWVMGCQ